jgi:hypothetical protein
MAPAWMRDAGKLAATIHRDRNQPDGAARRSWGEDLVMAPAPPLELATTRTPGLAAAREGTDGLGIEL